MGLLLWRRVDQLLDGYPDLRRIDGGAARWLVVAGARHGGAHEQAAGLLDFARELQAELAQVRQPTGAPLDLRLSICTGAPAVAACGSSRLPTQAYGGPVALAERMLASCPPHGLQICEATHRALGQPREWLYHSRVPAPAPPAGAIALLAPGSCAVYIQPGRRAAQPCSAAAHPPTTQRQLIETAIDAIVAHLEEQMHAQLAAVGTRSSARYGEYMSASCPTTPAQSGDLDALQGAERASSGTLFALEVVGGDAAPAALLPLPAAVARAQAAHRAARATAEV